MIDKKVLSMHFSRNAQNYDTYAKVQKKMAKVLLNMISHECLDKSKFLDILDIGCGTGYLTKKISDYYPNAAITAIDIAPGMVEVARQKFEERNINFICLDIEEADLNKKFDVIISNATFQWFIDPKGTINRLKKMLKKDGVLAFSTFGPMTFNELHTSYEVAQKKMGIRLESLPGQKFLSTAEVDKLCLERLKDKESFKINLFERFEYEYFETVKDFLNSVKKTGANNSNRNRKINTSITKEMISTYESMFKENGLICATYHCVFAMVTKIVSDNEMVVKNYV